MNLLPTSKGERFDRAIQARLAEDGQQASVREVRRGLRDGEILINGRKRSPGDRARGDEVLDLSRFVLRADVQIEADADALLRAAVLYEDATLLALAKPSGMNTAPLAAHERGTLLNAAVAHAEQIAFAGPPLEGGLLHRLDFDTSGVVLFAKDAQTRAALRAAFSEGRVGKIYDAIVVNALIEDTTIEAWLTQAGERARIAAPDEKGAMSARTEIRVLERFARHTHVEAIARSGRRHQIRVHLASLGAPIAGDPLYGEDSTAKRLALHARTLQLPDGHTITAPLPPDLAELITALRGDV